MDHPKTTVQKVPTNLLGKELLSMNSLGSYFHTHPKRTMRIPLQSILHSILIPILPLLQVDQKDVDLFPQALKQRRSKKLGIVGRYTRQILGSIQLHLDSKTQHIEVQLPM